MFAAAPFIIAKTWKQPKYSLIAEWIRMMWYMYTMEYCCCCCLVTKSGSTLRDPMDCSPPGSSVHRISQAKLLELVVISFSGAFPNPGIKPAYPALASRFFTTESPGKPCMPNGSPLFYTLNTSTEMVSIIIV